MSAAPAPWELFVIQHSHIDIGFTDRQEVIADFHRQFLAQAVRLALDPRQDSRPADARFKFTCEGFWAVEQFLNFEDLNAQADLVRAFRSGALELTAFYLHLTELLDAGHLRDSLRPAAEFARAHGIPLTAAMGCDINGLSWGMADALCDVGVRYLSMNINSHHGGFPLAGPLTPFYWEAPSGGRLLVWSGLPYHKANLLGLMGGYSPDQNPGIPGVLPDGGDGDCYCDVQDLTLAERKISALIAGLESSPYPYRFLPVMGSGLYTDNSPAGDHCCDLIAAWNARHGDRVHIQAATLGEYFAHLERTATDIPTVRGEWTDWWSDGVASAPVETRLFRHAQRTQRQIERLDPDAQIVGEADRREAARALTLFAEHTFGHSNTRSAALLTQQVFLRKTKLAVEADERVGRAWDAVRRACGEGEFTARRPFSYTVVNDLPERRTAVVGLPVDSWEQPRLAGGVRVVDAQGLTLPHQTERAPRGFLLSVLLTLEPHERRVLHLEDGGETPDEAAPESDGFSNAAYRLAWSRTQGIHSWIDAATGRELLSPDAAVGLGGPLYQVFPGANRGEPAGFLMAPRTIPAGEVHPGKCVGVRRTHAGPVFSEWTFDYQVAGASEYSATVRAYPGLPHFDLTVRLLKQNQGDPEGMYAAFPFALPGGVWFLDKPGGPIRPGEDQIPGTCADYFCLQEGAACLAPEGGIALATPDAPLVHLGGLNLWKYQTEIPDGGPLYSWLTNNKWECNFPIYLGGLYEFRYSLRPLAAGGVDHARAADAFAGCGARSAPPLVVRH